MESSTFFSFLLASILITLAPGPDILYLLTKSLQDGARSGISLAAGLVSGIVFHTGLVIVGVAAFFAASPLAMMALRFLGAAYLLWLARQAFLDEGKISLTGKEARIDLFALYRRGILMNVTNPKVLLFFLAFLPQFVDMKSPTVSFDLGVLGAVFALQAFVIFACVAYFAGKVRRLLADNDRIGRLLALAQGAVLAVIAVALIFE